MGQIEDLRLFVAVADAGGIARAAAELNIAKSAVSRRLAQLEERYGIRLIDRQPGIWQITAAGKELYERATPVVGEAADLDADFMHTGHSLKGPLSVSIAREFGMSYLKPVLFDFIARHPDIDLTLDFDDRRVDLDNENYDLAVRVTDSELSGLSAYKLGSTRHGLFASRRYAETTKLPETFGELTGHPLLHYGSARRARWDVYEDGRKKSVEFRPALNSNYGTFLLDAALQDMGIILLPYFVVASRVQDGALIPVLPSLDFPEFGIYVLHSAKRRLNKRMRALIDALSESCSGLGKAFADAP